MWNIICWLIQPFREEIKEESHNEPSWLTERRKEAINSLGEHWILHKKNYVKKLGKNDRKYFV